MPEVLFVLENWVLARSARCSEYVRKVESSRPGPTRLGPPPAPARPARGLPGASPGPPQCLPGRSQRVQEVYDVRTLLQPSESTENQKYHTDSEKIGLRHFPQLPEKYPENRFSPASWPDFRAPTVTSKIPTE